MTPSSQELEPPGNSGWFTKQILADHAKVLLPEWNGQEGMPNPPKLRDDEDQWWTGDRVDYPTRQARLRQVRLEQSQGDYTPDVAAVDDHGELLLIEIRVTHAVDSLKRARIQSEGRRLIEIDLSSLDQHILQDEGRLVDAVLYGRSNRSWLSCPEATEQWRSAHRELKEQVARRNVEIAKERQAKLDALDEERTKQTVQVQRRNQFREELRTRYQALLDILPSLVSHERIETLLDEYEHRDSAEAARLIAQIPHPAMRDAVSFCGQNAWIYRVHPSLWQAACYREFVARNAVGAQFNQRDLARWVMQNFGKEEELYALFRAQYDFRSQARKAGFRKNRISFWAFTELENRQIPNFYKPINDFTDRLVYLRALQRVPDILGEVRVVAR